MISHFTDCGWARLRREEDKMRKNVLENYVGINVIIKVEGLYQLIVTASVPGSK